MAAKTWWTAVCVLLASCGDSGGVRIKNGDGGVDAGKPIKKDAGFTRDGGGGSGSSKIGSACKKTADCGSGLFCDQEVDTSYTAQNLPGGAKKVPSSIFPGGSCTPQPVAAYDSTGLRSCDPTLPQPQQGCGADGVCTVVPLSQQNTQVGCRAKCDPADPKGCGRFGYTCDFDLKACVEGCQSDEECRLQLVDTNRDGKPDDVVYDDTSKATCDTKLFRCVANGGTGGDTGTACVRLDDCEADGQCLQPLQTYGGMDFPGGYCTKLGCDVKGRECQGQGAVCAELRTFNANLLTGMACFQGCVVGAEPEADRIGPSGHGKGCREGYRCHYNGGSGPDGVCVGGNYNGVSKNNIGDACMTDADCYSPFGLGNCLKLAVGSVQSQTGTCAIMDCGLKGLPEDLCGAGNACIALSGDVTFCVKNCTDATECAAGQACADDDGDSSTSKICYPACFNDADCRKGQERCNATASTMVGSCVASRQ